VVEQIRVAGLDELRRKLLALPKELTGTGGRGPVANALRSAGRTTVKRAKSLAPSADKAYVVYSKVKGKLTVAPGRIKDSIKIIRARQTSSNIEQFVIKSFSKSTEKKYGLGAYHWLLYEFGFTDRGGTSHAPVSYLRNAINDTKGEVVVDFARKLGASIDRIAKKMNATGRGVF
jgi:hypothetical protein